MKIKPLFAVLQKERAEYFQLELTRSFRVFAIKFIHISPQHSLSCCILSLSILSQRAYQIFILFFGIKYLFSSSIFINSTFLSCLYFLLSSHCNFSQLFANNFKHTQANIYLSAEYLMSFFPCSPKKVLEATLGACKDPSPTPQQIFSFTKAGPLSRKPKSPPLISLKNGRNSRLSLKKVQSSKSFREISQPSLTQNRCKKISKENIQLANDYGFFQWRAHEEKQKRMPVIQKRVSITYLSPEPKRISEDAAPIHMNDYNMFRKQSMTTQPSIREVKQSMSLLPTTLAGPFVDVYQTYFGAASTIQKKKDKEYQSKISFTAKEKKVSKMPFKIKKRPTLNTFNPKEIDSQFDGENSEREQQFSVVLERHQPVNPFEHVQDSELGERT